MNNDLQTLLYFTWILMALSGVFLYKSVVVINAVIQMKRRRKLFPHLEKAHPYNICPERHNWEKTKLVMAPLPVGLYKVCIDCGFVSTDEGNFKLNGPAIEVFKNNLKLKADELKKLELLQRRKQEEMDLVMKSLVREFVVMFPGEINLNGPTLIQFFRKSLIEIDVVYDKLNKEFEERRG